MELFTLKKIVGIMFMPLPIAVLLIILGVIAFLKHKRTSGAVFSVGGLFLLILATTPMVPDTLLRKIEKQYPQFDMSQPVSHIVVLGCSHVNDGTLPITAQVHHCSVVRAIEALRIHKQNPGSTIYTSGYAGSQPFSNAEMNKRLLIALGVDENSIKTISGPRDTNDESRALNQHLNGKSFALVTAASHMPRSMRLFQLQGLKPVAAPTAHMVRSSDERHWLNYMPHSNNIEKIERWWYETLGQTWITLRTWWAD